ncbi:MAG TPA: hypothetical protein VKU80_01540 [Planctomycetota bacterium]|nr:hypothetical protein [Planctomycetota bacterium]
MDLSAPLLTALVWLVPAVSPQEEDSLGPKRVNVQNASYNKVPNTTRGYIADAKIGDEVTVLAYEGSFAKVKRADGTEAYIAKSALIPSEQYVKGPSNEKEMGELKGQGYEAGRFDPETEASYKKEKGPEMEKAFQNVDLWEARQAWISQRGTLSRKMDEFRKVGKLAEYSNVK